VAQRFQRCDLSFVLIVPLGAEAEILCLLGLLLRPLLLAPRTYFPLTITFAVAKLSNRSYARTTTT